MSNVFGENFVRQDKRLAIYLRDNCECQYCGAKSVKLTLDHIEARVNGENNDESNLVTACVSCNSAKKEKNISEFANKNTIKRIMKQASIPIKDFRIKAKMLISKYGSAKKYLDTITREVVVIEMEVESED